MVFDDHSLSQVLKTIQPNGQASDTLNWSDATKVELKPGDYAVVEVNEVKGHALRGRALCRVSMQGFEEYGIDRMDRMSANLIKESFPNGLEQSIDDAALA